MPQDFLILLKRLGYYNVNQYEEINEAGIRNRVILQEYAYWIIYTSWNLRNSHG